MKLSYSALTCKSSYISEKGDIIPDDAFFTPAQMRDVEAYMVREYLFDNSYVRT